MTQHYAALQQPSCVADAHARAAAAAAAAAAALDGGRRWQIQRGEHCGDK